MSQLRTNSIVPVGGIPAGASGGGVIQAVTVYKTDEFFTTSTSPTDVTGLSLTITPRSTSNKILIISNVSYSTSLYTNGGFWNQYFTVTDGNNNVLGQPDSYGGRQRVHMGGGNFYMAGMITQKSWAYIWSPASTSVQTIKMRCWTSNGGDITVNKSHNENNVGSPGGNFVAPSSITALEISG
jgi:hypothetical protein